MKKDAIERVTNHFKTLPLERLLGLKSQYEFDYEIEKGLPVKGNSETMLRLIDNELKLRNQ